MSQKSSLCRRNGLLPCFGFLLGLLFCSANVYSANTNGDTTDSANTPAANLHRLLSELDSFKADYEQLVLDQQGSRLQQSQGRVWLQRPGKFRWDTKEPFPQLLVSDGKLLWLYDKDLEQVTQQKVDKRISQTPALLLTGKLDDLSAAFEVSGPIAGNEGRYQLVPRDENALFTLMNVTFEEGLPVEMQMEDSLGQQTSLAFFNIEPNPQLDDELFTFTAPAGVDLIVE